METEPSKKYIWSHAVWLYHVLRKQSKLSPEQVAEKVAYSDKLSPTYAAQLRRYAAEEARNGKL